MLLDDGLVDEAKAVRPIISLEIFGHSSSDYQSLESLDRQQMVGTMDLGLNHFEYRPVPGMRRSQPLLSKLSLLGMRDFC
jgi:hypothetical protein